MPVDNCRHLIVSSNEDWAVPMDLDDRRFFVLDISPHRKEDVLYFKNLDFQMQAGGVSALLYDLLHEDLTDFDPRKMPANDFGFDMKMKAASSVEKFIYEALKEGKFNLTPRSDQSSWGPMACERVVYAYYKIWVEYEGLKREASSEFGKRLKRVLSITKTRRSFNDIRIWGYEFPSLESSRRAFEKFTKQTSKIWEE